jgi:hypothetical protein
MRQDPLRNGQDQNATALRTAGVIQCEHGEDTATSGNAPTSALISLC